MITEVVESWTYVGYDDAQLLIMRGHGKVTPGFNDDQYKLEAHKVARWLIRIFCDKTIEFIVRELEEYKR